MKVFPFKIPMTEGDTLIYQEDRVIRFYDKLHQHEEIQVSFIVRGEGSLIVADTINHFEPGDTIVIGSNIPHVFKNDVVEDTHAFMISLFFTKNSFGEDFFDTADLAEIDPFFTASKNGFLAMSDKNYLKHLFLQLREKSKIDRFISFLELLKVLAKGDKKALSLFINKKRYTDNEGKRMSDIFEYAMSNYDQNISLETIASIANMSKNAFCRYFKQRTNKTFFQFLIEIRVENACKMLMKNHELMVGEIAALCGFQNISNFNRKFKEIKGITPSKYRRSWMFSN
ncbi:AraC family transcriptional regulator [Sungkyunkwania multivorans]|uniref:AraC family transcriptional regulator n=1 Tax=Sungkyunkwania multivorans TaxID=1173618 RepID=A0ABW3D421_9FLAO